MNTQISLPVYILPVSHYLVYHNVTSDGGQEIIITYDTNVTINVANDQFQTNTIYSIQVAAVNVIGQGPVNVISFSEFWVSTGQRRYN